VIANDAYDLSALGSPDCSFWLLSSWVVALLTGGDQNGAGVFWAFVVLGGIAVLGWFWPLLTGVILILPIAFPLGLLVGCSSGPHGRC
jgi:hypothetical protein